MLEAFKKHIEKTFPELFDSKFIIACSGGLDSMVLADLCHKIGLRFHLAHCNFRLRGKKSDGDENFVGEYAEKINHLFHVTHFDTIGFVNQYKVSVQMAARALRYSWFAQLLSENDIPFLLTAHHANDNLETFVINLSRGTGIDGLTGIPARTDGILRPLLPFARAQLEGYAQEEGLLWREDASNADTKYLRNKIRLEVIPKLTELHPTFIENFKNTQHYLGQTEAIASTYLQLLKDELFIRHGEKYRISVQGLKKLSPLDAFLYGLFNEYGFSEWENLKDLLDAMSGKQLLSNTHLLVKDREFLLLSPLQEANNEELLYLVEENSERIEFPVPLKFSMVNERYDNTEREVYIQKNQLKYPLEIRKWKKGDYFCPLGFNGKKKVSKFFKDEKIDVLSKKEIWLLCSDNNIVWIIGKRADHRFRVTDNNNDILKIEIT